MNFRGSAPGELHLPASVHSTSGTCAKVPFLEDQPKLSAKEAKIHSFKIKFPTFLMLPFLENVQYSKKISYKNYVNKVKTNHQNSVEIFLQHKRNKVYSMCRP